MYSLKWMYFLSVAFVGATVLMIMFSQYWFVNSAPLGTRHSRTSTRSPENEKFKASKSPIVQQLKDLDYKILSSGAENKTSGSEEVRPRREMEVYLPFPATTLASDILFQQPWVDNLKKIVSKFSPEEASQPIHIVTGNSAYQNVLLNWLIIAKVRTSPPVTKVVVLSLDKPLCDLLIEREFTCLHIEPKAVLRNYGHATPFRVILVMRLTAIRLLNYWGYAAANLDSDALVLKNMEPLYQKFNDSDMVAGQGIFPTDLGKMWGHTICGGTFMIRSTPNTENYWKTVSNLNVEGGNYKKSMKLRMVYDDQAKLNYAFRTMDPVWKKEGSGDLQLSVATTANGFKVTLVPERNVCRLHCKIDVQSQYYVWHHSSKKTKNSKTVHSKNADLWFLRDDWKKQTSNSTGEKWLKEISVL